MQRFRWIALQGSSRGFLPPLLLFVFLITTGGIPALAADVSAACSSPVARVVSIQGSIDLLRARQNDWSKVTRLDTPLCEGDRLRAGALSRAALFIQPETLVRVDQNTSISVSQTAEETRVEFTQEDIVAASATAHTCGAGYFITRFPRKFRVNTPHLSAAVEGTEFLVAMRCESTELTVFEGKVLAAGAGANIYPAQPVISGQTLTVGGSEPPAIKLQLKPADAVQWTLYYPPITPASAEPVEDCLAVAQDNRVSCLIAHAEQLLRAGREDEAQANIGDALAIAPYSSDAKALSSIISLVRNDKAEALRLAREAVEATANSAPALLALSYAQQADFKLEAALTGAQRAAELTPSSALALARVAELQLSLGWTREAEKTARQAVAANPSESRAHMILGFVHLAQINVKEAREDFGRAIELDSTEPLSRLGLGLAIIRKGNLVEGREQIEIAVALDPTNSLIRSYVGKAYYEENTKDRDQLASIQFGLAKELDPKDPTAWFYDAILKESTNQPGSALENLQQSIDLNDERAVYRSRLLLDQDVAARSANRAEVFSDLGFIQLGRSEALTSLSADPGSFSAHRFLADSYGALPRYGIARVSELLQSQLLQPATGNPLSPQLAENRLLILEGAGPPSASLQEFNPLFNRDRVDAYLSGVVGNNDTAGGEAVASLLHGGTGLSAGYFQYHTGGFRLNNDYSTNIGDVMMQHDVSAQLGLQAEFRTSRTQHGDIAMNFDPDAFSPNLRRELDSYSGRLGTRYSPDASSTLVGSFIYQRRNDTQTSFDDVSLAPVVIENTFDTETSSTTAEIQYLFRASAVRLTLGAGHYETRFDDTSAISFTLNGVPVGQLPLDGKWNVKDTNAYMYSTIAVLPTVSLVLGASADSYKDEKSTALDTDQVNPKVGLIIQPVAGTTVRAAWFRSFKRQLANDQTIEPTQVAGFNQFFDDVNATDSKSYGVGLDQRFGPHWFAGVEFLSRNLSVPGIDFNTGLVSRFNWEEKFGRAYVSWLAARNVAFGAEYYFDLEKRDIVAPAFPHRIETQYLPLTANYYHPSGFFVTLRPIYVNQSLEVGNFSGGLDNNHDDFWLFNAVLGYRLPARRGLITLEGQNLFAQSFHFQDIDPVGDPRPPLFQPERSVFLKVALVF